MLITCPECGGKVSDQAKACPHCGNPIKAKEKINPPTKERQFFKSKAFKALVLVIVAIVFIICLNIYNNRWNKYFDVVEQWNNATKKTEYYIQNKTNNSFKDVVVYFTFNASEGKYTIPQKVGSIGSHETIMVIYDSDKGDEYIKEHMIRSVPIGYWDFKIKRIGW